MHTKILFSHSMCSCDVSVHPPFYEDDNNQGLRSRSKGFVPKQHKSVVRDKDDDTTEMVGVDCHVSSWGEWSPCSVTCGWVGGRRVSSSLSPGNTIFRYFCLLKVQ